jgi:nucleotide-binding universal stress UspA family protein
VTGQDMPIHTPKRLLLATDLSARCDRALDRGVALAKLWDADLIVVHALEQSDVFYNELVARLPSWRQSDGAALVRKQLQQDVASLGSRVTVIVEKGDAADVILAAARRESVDFIVCGVARSEQLGRVFLGTTVDRLAREISAPLLVVKNRMRGPYRHILVATDFSESSRYALQTEMVYFQGESPSIFHAYDTPFSGLTRGPIRTQQDFLSIAKTKCTTFLLDAGIADHEIKNLKLILEYGPPVRLLQRYTQQGEFELVVVGSSDDGAVYEFLIGSTAKEILRDVAADVLVVRRNESPSR